MRAISLLFVLIAVATAAVVVAQPLNPLAPHVAAHAIEPAWMVLSGATLLGVASALRRYVR
jgi:hypothetical protein